MGEFVGEFDGDLLGFVDGRLVGDELLGGSVGVAVGVAGINNQSIFLWISKSDKKNHPTCRTGCWCCSWS